MRRILLLGALIVMTGCQNVVGPFRPKSPLRVDDPSIPISEQQSRGRARYALPDESPSVGPYSGPARPLAGSTQSR